MGRAMAGMGGCHLHWQCYFSMPAPDAAGQRTSSCIGPSDQQHIEETLICTEPITPLLPPWRHKTIPPQVKGCSRLETPSARTRCNLRPAAVPGGCWPAAAQDAQECCSAQGGGVCTEAALKALIARPQSRWQAQQLFFIPCK